MGTSKAGGGGTLRLTEMSTGRSAVLVAAPPRLPGNIWEWGP